MISILDRFNQSSVFVPATTPELFALRLAQKLGDASAVRHYVMLSDQYSEAQLLVAYRRALRSAQGTDRGRRFHDELRKCQANTPNGLALHLMSIRIERRTIAAAAFDGDHLEYADSRQLSSVNEKAVISAVGFINWMLARFPVEATALEAIPNGFEFQRRTLHDAICRTLRDQSLPIWEIPKPVLLNACGHPPLQSRKQLRAIASSIWPVVEGSHSKVYVQDAAILGLHAQIERHFILN